MSCNCTLVTSIRFCMFKDPLVFCHLYSILGLWLFIRGLNMPPGDRCSSHGLVKGHSWHGHAQVTLRCINIIKDWASFFLPSPASLIFSRMSIVTQVNINWEGFVLPMVHIIDFEDFICTYLIMPFSNYNLIIPNTLDIVPYPCMYYLLLFFYLFFCTSPFRFVFWMLGL